MIIQMKRISKKCSAAAHAWIVEEVAGNEPQDKDSEPEENTTESNPQHPNEQRGSSQDAGSNPSFDSLPQDILEDELLPWVDYMVRETHKAYEPLTANKITSWILQTEQDATGSEQESLPNTTTTAGQNSSQSGTQRCQPSRKRIGSKDGHPRYGSTTSAHCLRPNQVHGDNNDLTNNKTRLTTAQDGLNRESMERASVSSWLKQPTRRTTPELHDNDSQTNSSQRNKTQDWSPRRRRRRRRRRTIHPLPTNRKLVLKKPQATASNKQTSTTNSAAAKLLNLSETHHQFQRRYRPSAFQLTRRKHKNHRDASFLHDGQSWAVWP